MATYTNAEIRSILNGLGYRSKLNSRDPNFPISQDESDLTDDVTKKAIMKFQIDYDLMVDGTAGQDTIAKMQTEMTVLHDELNRILGTNIPADQPFYGLLTVGAIQQFQKNYIITVDGLASFPVREELYGTLHATTAQTSTRFVTA